MTITETALRLLLLFFPGIVAYYVVDALTEHPRRQSFEVLLLSFTFGVGSYVFLHLLYGLLNVASGWFSVQSSLSVTFFDSLASKQPAIELREIVYATLCAVALAILLSALLNYKLLHRIAHALRVSRKFGDLDVWSFVFNSPEVEWVVVRDLAHNLAFEGWVQAFSPTFAQNELLLRDVKVLENDSGKEMYTIGALYISRNQDDLTIEIPMATTEFAERPDSQDGGGEQGEQPE